MAYKSDQSFFLLKNLRCPVCQVPHLEAVIQLPGTLIYAKCEEEDCTLTELHRRDLLKKCREKIRQREYQ